MKAEVLTRERDRLRALRDAGVMDTAGVEIFDRIAALAARVFRTPVALLSFVDENREYLTAITGLRSSAASREIPLTESLARHAVESGEAIAFDDVRDYPELPVSDTGRALGWVAYAAAPVRGPTGHVLGVLAVADSAARTWSGDDILSLSDLAACVTTELERRVQTVAHGRASDSLRRLSLVDELTGLSNRRAFLALAKQQFKLAHRMGRDLLLIFVDVDDLASVNARRGRIEGDGIIRALGTVLADTFRESDVVARIGGDEFAVLALEGDRSGTEVVTARLYAALGVCNAGRAAEPIEISLGIARYDPERPSSILELLIRADAEITNRKRSKQA